MPSYRMCLNGHEMKFAVKVSKHDRWRFKVTAALRTSQATYKIKAMLATHNFMLVWISDGKIFLGEWDMDYWWLKITTKRLFWFNFLITYAFVRFPASTNFLQTLGFGNDATYFEKLPIFWINLNFPLKSADHCTVTFSLFFWWRQGWEIRGWWYSGLC